MTFTAVIVRRLHDTGRSGYFFYLSALPFDVIVLIVFYCLPGEAGDNRYGPPPAPLTGSAVTRGMTARQVTRLLGHPHERTAATAPRYARRATHGRLPERGYWHYPGLPDEDRETMLTFERGRVIDITVA
ncbi:DUF805 domain-containing protein [Actinoallomurus iriomotensis]|uniref:DUF805 domain-containing protein n=1 Tax=Actinoallomurus iriomotensis TaxID=478107 RepID=A0A9W6VM35_9ACTN|nr:DUF805 domain-containing protein [Actinoallomurus iriomotensis]GLY72279.1 hypothetical protein Airi01_005460 [Actinoallomurus iriomotensis]